MMDWLSNGGGSRTPQNRESTNDHADTLELVSCPLCGSDRYKMGSATRDFRSGRSFPYHFVDCQICGLRYLNPRPKFVTLARFYPPDYAPHAQLGTEKMALLQRWLIDYGMRKRCRLITSRQQQGTLLDVGCGNGLFLRTLKQRSDWKVVGIDINPETVEYIRAYLGIEAHVGDLRSLCLQASMFDAVTLWDSLEHMPQPAGLLEETWRILKPAGWLLIRVPSLDSLDARLFRSSWAGLDAPRHLIVFSRSTLAQLLQKTGFEVIFAKCLSGGHSSFEISMQYAELQWPRWQRVLSLFRRLLHSAIGRLASYPYFFLMDRIHRGPELTVLAQKKESNG